MKSFFFFQLLVVLLFASCQNNEKQIINIDSVASPIGTEVFQPDWDNIAQSYQFPEWFCDAKFGIFIHWGIYAVPAFANEWYSRNMYQKDSREYKYHIETYGEHTQFGYKDFIPMFKAEKFNADEWAKLFREAGARYVVPVAEHHDGFSMYSSDLNEWNSVKMGPQKDIVGLLKQALERENLIFGLSSHRVENAWFFNGGMEFPSDVRDFSISLYGRRIPNRVLSEDVAREWLERTYELVNKYQPNLIYFDGAVNNAAIMPYFNRFLAYYYNNALDWGKQVVANTKGGYPNNIQVRDVERGRLENAMVFPWQTCTPIGKKSWAYLIDEEYKTPKQIIHDLIDIVSKNGNLLLNVGPRADGTIPEEQQSILFDIGKWLKVNGEAIYETRCWKKFGEGDAEIPRGSWSDNTAVGYSIRDIRFTTKGNDFYVIVLDWDDSTGVLVKSLDKNAIADAKIQNVQLLGSNEKIEWELTDAGLKLFFPKTQPCDFAYTFKISFDKKVGEHLESEAVNEIPRRGAGGVGV